MALKQLNYDPCQNGSHAILLAPATYACGKSEQTNALCILLNSFKFMTTVLKTGNVNVQLVLQRCCKTSSITMLRVLATTLNLSCNKSGYWKLRKYRLLTGENYGGVTPYTGVELRHLLQNKFALGW